MERGARMGGPSGEGKGNRIIRRNTERDGYNQGAFER